MALRVGSVTPRFFASVTVSPASIGTSATATQNFTITGLQTDMCVYVNQITPTASVNMGNVFVSAANTLTVTFTNSTAATATFTASQELRIVAF